VTLPCTALLKGAVLLPNTNQTLSPSLPALREGNHKRRFGGKPKLSRHGANVAGIQRKIASYLHKGEPVPEALAKNLADLLWKTQRQRLGELSNMRRRGELR
jgi:hypothetical protein